MDLGGLYLILDIVKSDISIGLFQNSQLTVLLTVQIDGTRENVRSSGGSYGTVTVNNRQLSILEKPIWKAAMASASFRADSD